jgi:hypothetical protein
MRERQNSASRWVFYGSLSRVAQAKLGTKKQGKDGARAGPSCWPETPHALIPSFSDERLKRFPSARATAVGETVVRVPVLGAIAENQSHDRSEYIQSITVEQPTREGKQMNGRCDFCRSSTGPHRFDILGESGGSPGHACDDCAQVISSELPKTDTDTCLCCSAETNQKYTIEEHGQPSPETRAGICSECRGRVVFDKHSPVLPSGGESL